MSKDTSIQETPNIQYWIRPIVGLFHVRECVQPYISEKLKYQYKKIKQECCQNCKGNEICAKCCRKLIGKKPKGYLVINEPWDIARSILSTNNPDFYTNADSTDCAGFLKILQFCDFFPKKPCQMEYIKKVLQARNDLTHSPTFTLRKNEMEVMLTKMITLVTSFDQFGHSGLEELKKLQSEDYDINHLLSGGQEAMSEIIQVVQETSISTIKCKINEIPNTKEENFNKFMETMQSFKAVDAEQISNFVKEIEDKDLRKQIVPHELGRSISDQNFEKSRIKALQDAQVYIQKKTFTKWANVFLEKARLEIKDLFTDLADGKILMQLLEIISGENLGKPNKALMRVHKVENCSRCLKFLATKVHFENIGAEDIVDGNPRLILGLIWTTILHFQIQKIEIEMNEKSSEKKSAKDALLLWCQRKTQGYPGVNITNFTNSWRNGLGFNALIHAHRPDLINYDSLQPEEHIVNLNNAFLTASNQLGIPPILDAEDVDLNRPDEKTIITYVASYYHYFAKMTSEMTGEKRIAEILGLMPDVEKMVVDYETLTTKLLEWIGEMIKKLNGRDFPNSLEGIQKEMVQLKDYRTVEKTPKLQEKGNIEAQFFNIQAKLKANGQETYQPPEGQLIHDIETAWMYLERAEHEREVALGYEMIRQEHLAQLARRKIKMASNKEGQTCERKYCDSLCCYHPEKPVVSHCKECKKLVCLDCITSDDHSGHSFSKLESVCKDRENIIGNFIENNNRIFLPNVNKSITEIEEQENFNKKNEASDLKALNLWRENCIEFINKRATVMVTEIKTHYNNESILKLKDILIAKGKQLEKYTKEFSEILDHGTLVEKYDASKSILQKEKEVKTLPVIPKTEKIELVYVESEARKLIRKALGEIRGLPISPPKHQQTISSTTSFYNELPSYYALTPVNEDKSWCGVNRYNENDKFYYPTNKLCIINKQGSVEQELQTSANIRHLCLHPITGVLYGTFDDQTICTIDTTTGATTTVLTCPYVPWSITVTPDGDIIVGEWSSGHVYRHTSDGQLLHQSKEEYKVWDISYSDINDHVAIACDTDGVTIMDGTLTNVIHTHKLVCATVVYDRDGSLLIGGWCNRSIHILDSQTFSTIRTFTPPQMSHPGNIRLYDNSMWVECKHPLKVVHVMFQ